MSNDMAYIYKLQDWINMDKINWYSLSSNPNAIHLLEQNMDKICWNSLSANPNAVHLIEQNMDKINWYSLSANPNAVHLLEKNIDKISWNFSSQNPNIFVYDYDKMKQNRINSGIIEELIANVFDTDRLHRICEKYNIKFRELIQIY